jgi:hypothetical protein
VEEAIGRIEKAVVREAARGREEPKRQEKNLGKEERQRMRRQWSWS